MGKRKAAKKAPVKKSKPKLDTVFTCPFCNAESAVEASLDRKMKLGKLVCKACSESWGTEINALTEPIDLYSAWIDACEEAAADANA
ncbi:MAG: transcription elongation factor 1 family protein [bacterium]|jgi:transcription elongation factor Elf1|mmetsp:Transcript_5276/g.15092  ORF Transcript_5276/g.15092 Transcript_5276/m.15092 type:complete len:87 (+) Transcript_5276:1108-1368(+)